LKKVFCATPVSQPPKIVSTRVRRGQGSARETLRRENPERSSRPGFLSFRSYWAAGRTARGVGGWGDVQPAHGRQQHLGRGMGVPYGSPNDTTLGPAPCHIPLCVRAKGPVLRYRYTALRSVMSFMRAMLCFRRGTNGPNLTDPTRWLEPDRHRGLYFATVSPMAHYDAKGARLIALTTLLLSASGAVAQLPPPPIRVVPNLNPSSSLVLPGPARVAPTSPALSGARGCCYGTHRNRQHRLKKNHAHHGRRSHSGNTQEQIAEIQRRAAERAEFALESLFGETGGRAKGKQSRAKPKRPL
jgi:hypothetical protein